MRSVARLRDLFALCHRSPQTGTKLQDKGVPLAEVLPALRSIEHYDEISKSAADTGATLVLSIKEENGLMAGRNYAFDLYAGNGQKALRFGFIYRQRSGQ